jgi:hypothetical protein
MIHEWEAELQDLDTYRNEILPVKLAIDRWYVDNASPQLDALVVIALAQSLLGRRAETVIHPRVLANVPEAAKIPALR